jgi:hypothetical protein
MKAPATPENETDRLNSLRESGLLEIDSSPAFDRLTRLAKRFFQVPLAMVNLIDEHSLIVKSADGRRPAAFRVISHFVAIRSSPKRRWWWGICCRTIVLRITRWWPVSLACVFTRASRCACATAQALARCA